MWHGFFKYKYTENMFDKRSTHSHDAPLSSCSTIYLINTLAFGKLNNIQINNKTRYSCLVIQQQSIVTT